MVVSTRDQFWLRAACSNWALVKWWWPRKISLSGSAAKMYQASVLPRASGLLACVGCTCTERFCAVDSSLIKSGNGRLVVSAGWNKPWWCCHSWERGCRKNACSVCFNEMAKLSPWGWAEANQTSPIWWRFFGRSMKLVRVVPAQSRWWKVGSNLKIVIAVSHNSFFS